jgi:hypothetical protein
MPNWTNIGLTVKNTGRGYHDLLEIFTPDDAGENYLFEKFIPIPQGWVEDRTLLGDIQNLAKHGFKHTNAWCTANWGTKWDSQKFIMFHSDEKSFHVAFSTANGFPEPILKKMAQMFPEVYFSGSGVEELLNYRVDFVYRPNTLDGLICNFTDPLEGE